MQVDSKLGPLQDWRVTGIIFSKMENHLFSKKVPQKQPPLGKILPPHLLDNKVNTFRLISSPCGTKIKLLQSLEMGADASHFLVKYK